MKPSTHTGWTALAVLLNLALVPLVSAQMAEGIEHGQLLDTCDGLTQRASVILESADTDDKPTPDDW